MDCGRISLGRVLWRCSDPSHAPSRLGFQAACSCGPAETAPTPCSHEKTPPHLEMPKGTRPFQLEMSGKSELEGLQRTRTSILGSRRPFQSSPCLSALAPDAAPRKCRRWEVRLFQVVILSLIRLLQPCGAAGGFLQGPGKTFLPPALSALWGQFLPLSGAPKVAAG